MDGYNGGSGCIVLNWSAALAPVIVQQLQSTNVIANANENVLLSVQASGFLPLSYQWRHEGTNLPNATNTTYSITNVQFSHATNYAVVVTNNYGSITSSVAGVFVHGDSAARLTLITFNNTSAWFHVFGVTNRPYRIDMSTNLVSWTPVHTNWTSFWYTNMFDGNSPMRFFRAVTNS